MLHSTHKILKVLLTDAERIIQKYAVSICSMAYAHLHVAISYVDTLPVHGIDNTKSLRRRRMIEYKTIRDLCSIVVDCPHSTPTWTVSGKIVVRNNNIKNGRIDFSSPSYTDDEHFQQRIKRATPQGGDIIITREAPMGEVGMIPEGAICCLGQRMVLLRANPDLCDNYYLLYSLQSTYVQHQISWSEGTGTTVSNLRIPHLEQLKIPYLPLLRQKQISSILKCIEAKIELNRVINDNLAA